MKTYKEPIFLKEAQEAICAFIAGAKSSAELIMLLSGYQNTLHQQLFFCLQECKNPKELSEHYSLLVQKVVRTLWETLSNRARGFPKDQLDSLALFAFGALGSQRQTLFGKADMLVLVPPKWNAPMKTALCKGLSEDLFACANALGFRLQFLQETQAALFTKSDYGFPLLCSLWPHRLVAGQKGAVKSFQTALRNAFKSKPFEVFWTSYTELKKERHAVFRNTPFIQEPNILYGVGGLVDYEVFHYIASIYLDEPRLDNNALVQAKILTQEAHNALDYAYNYILGVCHQLRLETHYASKVLYLENQLTIAGRLGWKENEGKSVVEAFMGEYYDQAANMHQLIGVAEDTLYQDYKKHKSSLFTFEGVWNALIPSQQTKKHIDGFILTEGIFYAEKPDVFNHDPVRLIRIFRHAQQFQASLDPSLKELIRKHAHWVDETLIANPEAKRSFVSILETVGSVYPTLCSMHNLGILGRFIPEFGNINHYSQQDPSQRYTADLHALESIAELDAVFSEHNKYTQMYEFSIRNTQAPALLYWALFLYDIAHTAFLKGSQLQARRRVVSILERFGFREPQQARVLFMIENQHQMMHFWQHLDVDDPKNAQEFADFLGDPELLNYLYVETYCSTRAAGRVFWNNYKEALHTKLFRNTLSCFEVAPPLTKKSDYDRSSHGYRTWLQKYYPRWSDKALDTEVACYPERYFRLFTPEEIQVHMVLVQHLKQKLSKADCSGSLMPLVHWQEDINRSCTAVTIVTWDRSGLFASIAAAFACVGLNILNSKIISRSDRITIHKFEVIDAYSLYAETPALQKEFERYLSEMLIDDVDPFPYILAHAKKTQKNLRHAKNNNGYTPQVKYDVNVYYDCFVNETIVQLHCPDRIGLLYETAKAITEQGFDIFHARISTENGVANDTFHIQKLGFNEKIPTRELIVLREALNRVLLHSAVK